MLDVTLYARWISDMSVGHSLSISIEEWLNYGFRSMSSSAVFEQGQEKLMKALDPPFYPFSP